MKYYAILLYLSGSFLLSACDKPETQSGNMAETQNAIPVKKVQSTTKIQYKEIDWEDLVPEGYRPDDVLEEYQTKYNIDELEDSDPLVIEVQAKLKELMASAPVDESFEGKSVKLPGYLLPLDSDGQTTSEFLLNRFDDFERPFSPVPTPEDHSNDNTRPIGL